MLFRSDIPLLVDHFIEKYNQRLGKQLLGISSDAMSLLTAYGWPGNIRELENVLERAVLFADGDRIFAEHLPAELLENRAAVGEASSEEVGLKEQVRAAVSQLERQLIYRALEQMKGNVTHTARVLKLSRKGLQLKMKELGLRDLSLKSGKDIEN